MVVVEGIADLFGVVVDCSLVVILLGRWQLWGGGKRRRLLALEGESFMQSHGEALHDNLKAIIHWSFRIGGMGWLHSIWFQAPATAHKRSTLPEQSPN